VSKKRVRIIKTKGKEYAQEVIYKWDSEKKVGKTIVTRHIGPISQLSPNQIKSIQSKLTSKRGKNRYGNDAQKTKSVKSNRKESEKISYPSLTPSEEIVKQTFEIIKGSNINLSRNEVYNILVEKNIELAENQELKKNVGFALTILDREGKINKTGKGRKGDPYRYATKKKIQ
jgi:hypothetical protein